MPTYGSVDSENRPRKLEDESYEDKVLDLNPRDLTGLDTVLLFGKMGAYAAPWECLINCSLLIGLTEL